MTIRELLRRRMLVDLYNNLSESDKRCLLQSFKDGENQAQTLYRIESKIDKQTFSKDLLANISGNAISYTLYYLGKMLFRNL